MKPAASTEEQDALARLSRTQGPASLGAAVLSLIAQWDTGSTASRALRAAWNSETQSTPNAEAIDADVALLSAATRLPCLEALLQRVRRGSKDDRRALLQATRRVMAARSPTPPIYRLLWLAMRRQLGERPPAADLPAASNDLTDLPTPMRSHIAVVTAHLSRLVPGAAGSDDRDGAAWYALVLERLMPQAAAMPNWPDGDTLAHALLEVQTLPWMLRPVLVRAWVDAASQVGPRVGLSPTAADALRLVAGLLDSPLPPELARRYTEPAWGP
ncbi:MAG: hypothetical protein V9G29_18945 [Burkholderiaceae bacterium]